MLPSQVEEGEAGGSQEAAPGSMWLSTPGPINAYHGLSPEELQHGSSCLVVLASKNSQILQDDQIGVQGLRLKHYPHLLEYAW